ncbi:MAG: DUF2953 domain-containing protein [Methanomicrobiales archaeon]|nr:DUF2953 domain-containing protein [Methanomicrobiales archaeon]
MDILFWILVVIAILILLFWVLSLYVTLLPIDIKLESEKYGIVVTLAVSVIQGIVGVRIVLEEQGPTAALLLAGRPVLESRLPPILEEEAVEVPEKVEKPPEPEKPLPSIDEIESSYTLYLRPSTYQALAHPEAYLALLSPDTLKVLLDSRVRYRIARLVQEVVKSFSIERIDLKTALGSENPETAGLLYGYGMAVRGMLYAVPNLSIQIDPLFDRNVLEWHLKTRVRFSWPIRIYIAVLRIFLERKVLDLVHKMVIAGSYNGQGA